jgi:hypothetical protein
MIKSDQGAKDMPTMRELSRWIRDYGHNPRHLSRLMSNRFIWHQLWTATDIIDDVESAMTAYVENEFPSDLGEKYLRVYGAMQGLFIQQDALRDLIKAIHPARAIVLTDVLKDIRDARHASVGHPTKLNRKGALSAHGIVQNSIRKDGFDLLSYPEKDGKMFQHVPVLELIEKQRAEAVRILSEVVEDLREQERAHREQFREIKLRAVFDGVSYAFEKIFEEVRPGSTFIMGSWGVGHLQKSLDDFETLLKDRGLSIDMYDSIEYFYDEIKHPLTELTKYIKREPSEISSRKSAVVFTDALQGHFDSLRDIAGELDEDYASAPDPVVQSVHPEVQMTFTTTVIGKKGSSG